jgi:hypothetical protein
MVTMAGLLESVAQFAGCGAKHGIEWDDAIGQLMHRHPEQQMKRG